MKNARWIVFAVLFSGLFHTASAWLPTGWVWMDPPDAYVNNDHEWYYFSETDSLYYQDTVTLQWRSISTARGWHYFRWPYSYSFNDSRWFYYSQTDRMYALDHATGTWSRLGNAGGTGDVTVTLTWDTEADLDLHVTDPNGETIYWAADHSASGYELDVDDQNGFGPENIFWPAGGAPGGEYAVVVKHYDGTLPSSYRVIVAVQGRSTEYSGTLTNSQESHDVTRFTVSGGGGGPSAPSTAIQPADGAIVQGYGFRDQEFEWNPVPGAASYKFRLEGPTIVTHDRVESSGVWARDIQHGDYRWRVATYNSAGEMGPWSPWFRFTYRTPSF